MGRTKKLPVPRACKPLGKDQSGVGFRACEDQHAIEIVAHGLVEGPSGERGEYAGTLSLKKQKVLGQDLLVVNEIEVVPKYRKHRLGTRMYEWAAKIACRLGVRLSSSHYRSEFSESFWRKQERKGRASCVATGNVREGQPGRYYAGPRIAVANSVDDDTFERIMSHLPKPERDAIYGQEYWPCHRYEVPCPAPRSLAGVKRRR